MLLFSSTLYEFTSLFRLSSWVRWSRDAFSSWKKKLLLVWSLFCKINTRSTSNLLKRCMCCYEIANDLFPLSCHMALTFLLAPPSDTLGLVLKSPSKLNIVSFGWLDGDGWQLTPRGGERKKETCRSHNGVVCCMNVPFGLLSVQTVKTTK